MDSRFVGVAKSERDDTNLALKNALPDISKNPSCLSHVVSVYATVLDNFPNGFSQVSWGLLQRT